VGVPYDQQRVRRTQHGIQVAQHARRNTGAGVAVAGGVGRTHLQGACGPMGDDPGYGVAAAVVIAEALGEKAPDGSDGAEHSVAILETMLIQSIEDADFAQGVGERQSLVARKASADHVQGSHRRITKVSSGNDANPGGVTADPSPDKGCTSGGSPPASTIYTWQRPARCGCNFIRVQDPRVPLS
jgi:hypothetical protein